MSDQQEELIYGKNAVLAYLEHAENGASLDFRQLKEALAREAGADAAADDEEQLEQEIARRLKEMSKRSGKSLNLPSLKQLQQLQTVKVNKILLAAGSEHDGRVDKIK